VAPDDVIALFDASDVLRAFQDADQPRAQKLTPRSLV
jgi:hypothetical protein